MYKWTCEVQICVVQEPTAVMKGLLLRRVVAKMVTN